MRSKVTSMYPPLYVGGLWLLRNPSEHDKITIRITNICDFLYYVFISFFSSFPYMFRALRSPSSGVFQAVVFMLPFGSRSALLIVCVRQRTGLCWWLRCKNNSLKYPWWWAHASPKHVGKRREKGNKDIVQKVASVGNSYCNKQL